MRYYQQEKVDNHSSDHGYHGSYETGTSSSSSASLSPTPSQMSIRRWYMINQLPLFVTKCKSVNEGFLVEMNVDGSDEEPR